MGNEQKNEVRLEIPEGSKTNLRHAVDYYRKISYHRGLVLEGVRLSAMRNRGFWHGIYQELSQEKRRPIKPEEIQDRIRAIQKKRGEATYRDVLHEYNNQRISTGLSPVEDGGPFGVIHELKSSMERRLVVPIIWSSWEIYMCLLYVEIEAYRSHTESIPELKDRFIDKFFQENQRILEALKKYRDKVLHPQGNINEGQIADQFFDLVGNSVNDELELVFTIQRMIDCHIRCVGLGIIQSMDSELVELLEICKSGQKPRIREKEKFGRWIERIGYIPPNVNLMTSEEFGGNTKKSQAPNLSFTSVIPLVSLMMKHNTKEDGTTCESLELPGDTDYVKMLMRAFIFTSEGMGLADTAKLLRSTDPKTLPLTESLKSMKEGAEPETLQEVQNLMALERVALALLHEPLRTYSKMVKKHRMRVPGWMAQSIPTEEAEQQLRNYRNIVFHVKVGNHNSDNIEWKWIQNTEQYPAIETIHALLSFYGYGKGFKERTTQIKDERRV